MSTSGTYMTTLMQQAVRLLAVWLAVALIGPQPFARPRPFPVGVPPAQACYPPVAGRRCSTHPTR